MILLVSLVAYDVKRDRYFALTERVANEQQFAITLFLEDEDTLTWLVWPGQRPPDPLQSEAPPSSEPPPDEDEAEGEPTDRQLLEANLANLVREDMIDFEEAYNRANQKSDLLTFLDDYDIPEGYLAAADQDDTS